MALIAACQSFWCRQCSDRYIISLSAHLHTPFTLSLISLIVSVDVKHNVYILILAVCHVDRYLVT